MERIQIEQIYTGCLSQAAYYLESEGEAAVIDPMRNPEPYLKRAQKSGSKIRYIFETHFHADFVSGHLELARATGAKIIYGPGAKPVFEAVIARDGDRFPLGKAEIEILHTPGHTLESSCFLIRGEGTEPGTLFTGDTLFLGDVGRPDLAVNSESSREALASLLYDSLYQKILPLPDSTVLYPGHGAGSACGKKMSADKVDSLGHQKALNYALQPMDKAAFIHQILAGIVPAPKYFPMNVKLNREGYGPLSEAIRNGKTPLSPAEFENLANLEQALIIDTRSPESFSQAHIPKSIFIGLDGNFASWAGTLLVDPQQALLYVCESGREEEVVDRLTRVGLDRVLGYLAGGIPAWVASQREVDEVANLTAQAFATLYANTTSILDVRTESEFSQGHLRKAQNLPLDILSEHREELPPSEAMYLHCGGGYRSMIAISILKARGYHNLINLQGGFQALSQTDLPMVKSGEGE